MQFCGLIILTLGEEELDEAGIEEGKDKLTKLYVYMSVIFVLVHFC